MPDEPYCCWRARERRTPRAPRGARGRGCEYPLRHGPPALAPLLPHGSLTTPSFHHLHHGDWRCWRCLRCLRCPISLQAAPGTNRAARASAPRQLFSSGAGRGGAGTAAWRLRARLGQVGAVGGLGARAWGLGLGRGLQPRAEGHGRTVTFATNYACRAGRASARGGAGASLPTSAKRRLRRAPFAMMTENSYSFVSCQIPSTNFFTLRNFFFRVVF